jgi:hypothetical protein
VLGVSWWGMRAADGVGGRAGAGEAGKAWGKVKFACSPSLFLADDAQRVVLPAVEHSEDSFWSPSQDSRFSSSAVLSLPASTSTTSLLTFATSPNFNFSRPLPPPRTLRQLTDDVRSRYCSSVSLRSPSLASQMPSLNREELAQIPLCFASCSIGQPTDPLADRLEHLRSAGYSSIELSFPDLLEFAKTEVNGGKEVGEKEWDTLVKAGEKVKELCREKGLKIFILQPFGASFSSFPTLSFPSLPPSSSH